MEFIAVITEHNARNIIEQNRQDLVMSFEQKIIIKLY